MFGEDESREAIIAVAAYVNGEEEQFEIVRGDVFNNLIYVRDCLTHPGTGIPHAYVYSLNSKRVFAVAGEVDPITALATIANVDGA